jgi:hypothetical protein
MKELKGDFRTSIVDRRGEAAVAFYAIVARNRELEGQHLSGRKYIVGARDDEAHATLGKVVKKPYLRIGNMAVSFGAPVMGC